MLNDAARHLIESGALAHLVTVNEDGSPQLAVVWVGLDGDELVSGHLDGRQQKLHYIRRDPRVALSFEAEGDNGVSSSTSPSTASVAWGPGPDRAAFDLGPSAR